MSDLEKRDICERLQAVADLRPGDMLPDWLYEEDQWGPGNWASGMSKLLREAIAEIRKLRGRS